LPKYRELGKESSGCIKIRNY